MSTPDWLSRGLSAPAIVAPMFLISGVDLVLACCRAGLIGSFPVSNARTIENLESWMSQISSTLTEADPPWALNMIVHRSYSRLDEELELVKRYKPPVVITALGSPARVIDTVHGYGGLVFADVNSVEQARRSAEYGVDGLVLVCAGAGGHTGGVSPFAFIPAVRQFFDGVLVAGGAVSNGRSIAAMKLLGADFAYIGTSFIASEESLAQRDYKDMVVRSDVSGIVQSAALTGAPANWLKESLLAAGYDPELLKSQSTTMSLGDPDGAAAKRWRDVWSAGQGVGEVKRIEAASAIIDRLSNQYRIFKVSEGDR